MIHELVEFGKRVTKGKSRALKEETYSIILVIDELGVFQKFIIGEKRDILAEAITAKKGKSRFLLDKCEEVLGIGEGDVNKKHELFLKKLECYKTLPVLEPIFKFYDENNINGLRKAKADFEKLDRNDQKGNITFMVGATLLLKTEEVKNAIIKCFEEEEQKLVNGRICSICGSSQIPVLDEPHGLVKMPKGQSAGSALVSYNDKAFESYGLIGNLNSSICRECARNYIDGLSFLLSDGLMVKNKENDKKKTYYHYKHRINISDTTVVLFWTKQETEEVNLFMIYDEPNEVEVRNLFESVLNGDSRIGPVVESNMFYSLTLSSAAARIAVRDWTAISLEDYKCNLADWFQDIEIQDYNGKLIYSPLRLLISAFQRRKKQGERAKSDLVSKARIGSILWNAAIKGRSYKIPLEILQSVLNRIYVEGEFSPYRAAIIKLIINRNTNKNMESHLNESNRSIAYMCGRLFAVIESMQWKAIGNVNSGIKERFFAAAVSQPAYVFGSLLTKNVPIYQHKIGGYLAKELNEIAGIISERGSFPQRFTLIEQGEFALGYYFQQTHKINNEKLEGVNS
ncbi:MAG: type I-C CRISPR-associated protein Cas8c/Csd1 [Bacteroidales bacterium]|nr:type I-C CRISPR-associated protein Cas8c/Csd1 [Bacteroidales bacterium]